MEFYHKPVLLEETINLLDPKPGGVYVDATLGGGGHFSEILKRVGENGTVIGIDRDEDAVVNARERFSQSPAATIVHDNFKNIKRIVYSLGLEGVDGVIFDLGVSSYQLDEESRGFSYIKDAPLDMRMDRNQDLTAKDVVNKMTKSELAKIIKEYGEERWADRIAEFICEKRKKKPIETTGELVEIIKAAIPARARRGGPHPAKRTFQALRIYVNGELEILSASLKDAVDILNPGGRICVITFHSLEDRIVKHTFRELAKGCTCPKDSPLCTCKSERALKILTPKPVCPTQDEIDANPRARSAKLRACEKLSSK
ncbi:16S rRNA (cytosine(1402)-N(4))-methyltransferase RsmH [Thermosediminibacter oceani]|uniref:Ribosomal RNA small subunit methyltransferase H n=1 Tax=Thermosediminibacter oceani (strain ATCC BAA-1034 / DSM 16646 / JW/IW-1228P) TaxID=555079 RepID=D9S2S9_THEOJ|nr:16S rRNA (cytosine(1402)-N(4))-methyltransferase RsmH [Thermosediminibacter oceani]ADL07706.1 S-adenosyl-methyltransferase MraW [Thermosediminibacter oceani DSM 16646]